MKKTLRFLAAALALAVSTGTVSAETAGFADVKSTDYFYDAVCWGTEAGITSGVGDNLFAPEGEVTRAQVVTFLWNMAGNPGSAKAETFSDVAAENWYGALAKQAGKK